MPGTHLDEADQLASHVAVIDHGRVIAGGTPDELKSQIGADRIDVVVRAADDLAPAASALHRVTGCEPAVDRDSRLLSAPARERVRALSGTVRALEDAEVAAEDIALRRPTLDEVFLHLTGRAA